MERLHAVRKVKPGVIASATLAIDTAGEGFVDITGDAALFLREAAAQEGVLLIFLRHTSASLVIQENADPDVLTDLTTALHRLAPADAGWVHDAEGPDDMPGHVKTMLTGVCLHVPVTGGAMALGTWQAIYLAEHRTRPHRREVILQFLGTCRDAWAKSRRRSGPSLGEPEQQDRKDDQRSLHRQVRAERHVEQRHGDLVQRPDEGLHPKGEDRPAQEEGQHRPRLHPRGVLDASIDNGHRTSPLRDDRTSRAFRPSGGRSAARKARSP